MTRAEFREWLQAQLTASDCHEEHGDTWREIESEGLLPEGVQVAADHLGHSFIFGLSDGLLASTFEFGAEGETVWFFVEDDVNANLRDYSEAEAETAVWAMRTAASELDGLLADAATPTPTQWFAAAAYGDRDHGEGPTRLFARMYDHEPTHEEIRQDAFVAAVPDWEQRCPRYTCHAAAYEWETTLTDALTINIIPAIRMPGPSHDSVAAVTTAEDAGE